MQYKPLIMFLPILFMGKQSIDNSAEATVETGRLAAQDKPMDLPALEVAEEAEEAQLGMLLLA